MRLKFTMSTHFRAEASCRNLRTDFSTVGLYYVTITWQRILKCSLQVTVVSVLPHVTVERRHL